MHIKNPLLIDQVRVTCVSAAGDGMHVELAAADDPNPLLTFREDEQLGLQAVIHLAKKDVVLSLTDLKRAIATAELEVHAESFYDDDSSTA